MQVGLYFDLRNPPPWRQDWSRLYGFTLEMCEEAERLGASSIWLSEHHLFEDGYLPQPLTFAAAVAARTRRVRIGTAILIAPLRSATQIAEEAAVVDIISGGRLELGLGAGYRVPEFELFGADIARRYATTDDRARELRAIWSAGLVTPPPVQERVPIWMGYQGPQGARRAGLLGEGLLSIDPSLLEPYRAGLAERGADPAAARMAGVLSGFVSEDPEADWPMVGRHLAYQWDSYRRYMVEGTGRPDPPPIDPAQWRQRSTPSGLPRFLHATPSDAADAIRTRLGDLPIQTVYLWASLAGMPEDVVARHVQLVCTQLRPLLEAG